MRKFISVICLLSLIFLSSCTGNSAKKITVADAGYTCSGLVNYGENFSSNITVNAIGGGVFSLTINTPEDIDGLTFYFDNSEMTITYKGVESQNSFPLEYGGFAEILNEIFLKFTTSKFEILNKNGIYVYEGSNSKYSFEIVFNEEGFPLSIAVDEENLKATFSNWRY